MHTHFYPSFFLCGVLTGRASPFSPFRATSLPTKNLAHTATSKPSALAKVFLSRCSPRFAALLAPPPRLLPRPSLLTLRGIMPPLFPFPCFLYFSCIFLWSVNIGPVQFWHDVVEYFASPLCVAGVRQWPRYPSSVPMAAPRNPRFQRQGYCMELRQVFGCRWETHVLLLSSGIVLVISRWPDLFHHRYLDHGHDVHHDPRSHPYLHL